ncbi:MAG: helix-turn-helix transcriptional regulator [Bacteroidales bacterium]|nr:helix-turn-helix transcriptional regulator [Bacteroidales bacterium]
MFLKQFLEKVNIMDLKEFRKANGLTQAQLGEFLGMKKSFISKIENGKEKLPPLKFRKLLDNDQGWDVSMLTEEGHQMNIGGNASGVIVNGNNVHSPIDNRQYYSDSPDVLRATIDLLDERIKEKDAQIKEKDAQIKEKDAQISRLLDILSKK